MPPKKPKKKVEKVGTGETEKDPENNVIKIDVDGKESKNLKQWWANLTQKHKRTYVILGIVSIIIVTGLAIVLFRALGLGKWTNDSPVVTKSETTREALIQKEPKDYELPLTGKLVTKTKYDEVTKKRPLAVIVENHLDARPQSGLNDADLVWEALAEGGISRFMPIYLENTPDKVGPVRSLRKYFLDWNAELRDGLIMHIGTAYTDNVKTNALGYVTKYNVKALGFLVSNSFWRVSDRYAPHNAYSSTKDLWEKSEEKGWTGVVNLDKWQYKEDAGVEFLGETKEVSFNWWGWSQTAYSVTWKFDPVKNEYLREHNGVIHTDAESGDQISAKNIVLQVVPAQYTVDTDGKSRLVYSLIGEGEAFIFQDAKVIKGTWEKSDRVARTKYYNEAGQEIKFNRGRTWISVLPTGSDIIY